MHSQEEATKNPHYIINSERVGHSHWMPSEAINLHSPLASSELSTQSFSPSHSHPRGMHSRRSSHWNLPEAQDGGAGRKIRIRSDAND